MTGAKDGAGRTILITGASSGIGEALARVFARNGFGVVLTARRAAVLEALKTELETAHGVAVYALPMDLAQAETPVALAAAIAARGLQIDGVVNNAGYNLPGVASEQEWARKRDLLQVMAIAPYELTHLFLPGMRARGFGRILNVASVVGLLPGAVSNTLYSGVKAMQVGFSEALHAEHLHSGVHVTALCPGLTTSGFHDADGSRQNFRHLPKSIWHTSDDVAVAGYAALARNDVLCVPGVFYKSAVVAARLLPRKLSYRLAARAGRSRRG